MQKKYQTEEYLSSQSKLSFWANILLFVPKIENIIYFQAGPIADQLSANSSCI